MQRFSFIHSLARGLPINILRINFNALAVEELRAEPFEVVDKSAVGHRVETLEGRRRGVFLGPGRAYAVPFIGTWSFVLGKEDLLFALHRCPNPEHRPGRASNFLTLVQARDDLLSLGRGRVNFLRFKILPLI